MFVKDDQTSAEDDLNRPSFHSENVADTNIDDGSQNQPSKQYSSETDAYYPIPKYLKYLILLPFIFPVASVLVSSLLSIVHGASFSSSDSPLGFIFLFSGIIFAIPSLTIARNIFRKDINFPKWFFWNLLLILPIIYMIIAYSVTSASVLGNSIKMIFGSIFMFTGIISLMLPRIIM